MDDNDYIFAESAEELQNLLSFDEESNEKLGFFPYVRIYQQPFEISNIQLDLLLPKQPLKLQVLKVVREIEVQFFHNYIFYIQVQHGNFHWIVKKNLNEIEKLCNSLKKYNASLKSFISFENIYSVLRRKSSLRKHENLDIKRRTFQQYLNKLLQHHQFINHRSMMEFLQITPLSFISMLGDKNQECIAYIKLKNHIVGNSCLEIGRRIFDCTGWKQYWITARDSFIILLNPLSGRIIYVMLMDSKFKVKRRFLRTGFYSHITIRNLSKKLLVDLENKRRCKDWINYLRHVANSTAKDFIKKNRFRSFVPIRFYTRGCWFVDGENYFECVANALEAAKEEIFISGWWISPEFHLKRPSDIQERWRLDNVLERIAIRGIKIFILLYKEVESALAIDSAYTKITLTKLHNNIKVLRHPDHNDLTTLLWAHHEKVIVIDQSYAFVGGLDICYGRWDNKKHKLTDFGTVDIKSQKTKLSLSTKIEKQILISRAIAEVFLPKVSEKNENNKKSKWNFINLIFMLSKFRVKNFKQFEISPFKKPQRNKFPLKDLQAGKLWLGKQYTNFVYKELRNVREPLEDLLDRNIMPRMPWHDVSSLVIGSAARDVARHFIQRWNAIKSEKLKYNDNYPWLLPKAYVDLSTIEPFRKCPELYLLNSQICRSASLWSTAITTCEYSIQNAYIHYITNAKYYIYIENQFFITHPPGDNKIYNEIWEAIYNRILLAYSEHQTFRIYVVIPLMPGFHGDIGSEKSVVLRSIAHNVYTSVCKGSNSLLERLCESIPDPTEYINFFSLRNYSFLNGKYVSEMIYVHSKLLIVDDDVAIIGSANLNDRSLLGRRDSEIAIIFNDHETISSTMNGAHFKAGKFSFNLRKRLFSEHLGLSEDDPILNDPISDFFYKQVCLKTAIMNTALYEKIFRIVPTNETTTYDELMEYAKQAGLADTNEKLAVKLLQKIKGYIILFPLLFLNKENLKPSGLNIQRLLPNSVFT